MNIEIMLPDRLGDALLSLPAILGLKQLAEKFDTQDSHVVIYPPASLFETISALNLYKTALYTPRTKLRSWFRPADKTFFLYSSNKSLGLRTKMSYGLNSRKKRLVKYHVNMPYLGIEKKGPNLPEDLVRFLQDKFGFSFATIRFFGICLALGYSIEQMMETFTFNLDQWALPVFPRTDFKIQQPYLVFCMEAAYGSKREAKRRWQEDAFVKLAEKCYETYQYSSVFIGLQNTPSIPKRDYFIDLRQKMHITALLGLLQHAQGFIGNDSGPLHLANLVKTPSVCIYLSTTPQAYGPIMPQYNTPVVNPDGLDTAWHAITQMIAFKK